MAAPIKLTRVELDRPVCVGHHAGHRALPRPDACSRWRWSWGARSRTEAAQAAGMDRQTLRDWVHRYNEEGLSGLTDEEAWSDRAAQLAVDIAGRLAARLHGDAVSTAFLDWLVRGYRALPPEPQRSVAALEAVSPAPLSQWRTVAASWRPRRGFEPLLPP